MNDKEFKCFLELLMCADPWPVEDDGENQAVLQALADEEAKRRRFTGWLDAFHNLCGWKTSTPTIGSGSTRARPLDCIGMDPEKQSTGKADSLTEGDCFSFKMDDLPEEG